MNDGVLGDLDHVLIDQVPHEHVAKGHFHDTFEKISDSDVRACRVYVLIATGRSEYKAQVVRHA